MEQGHSASFSASAITSSLPFNSFWLLTNILIYIWDTVVLRELCLQKNNEL